MDKQISNKLLMSPPTCTTAQSLSSTCSATGNPRNKCALKPGHSLMDWIRLGNSGKNLSGTSGRLIPVSKEELAKHNKISDAWIAIHGVVYNITYYMDFHPGGIEELMRGVGSDATKLFTDTHAWVNYSQLLNKCCVGPLKTTHKVYVDVGKSLTLPINNTFQEPPQPVRKTYILPRFDWTQKRDRITLYFYTKQFCNPGSLIRYTNSENNRIEIWVFIDLYVHKFDFELNGSIKWPPEKVKISTESGKIEINLNKHDEHLNLWNDLGKCNKSQVLTTDIQLETIVDFKIVYKKEFNEDSFLMLLQNGNALYYPPVGYHLTIEDYVNGQKIEKCYTPVPKAYIEKYINIGINTGCINFLIKNYANPNSFSLHLRNLQQDSRIRVSQPKGTFNLTMLATHKKICFLAAGSGLTPFLGLIDHLLNRNTNRIEVLKLLYFNKTIADIWCNEVLQNISIQDKRFEFVNVLSKANESWPGLKGQVSSALLSPIVDKALGNISYIAVCGPLKFNAYVEAILSDLNFPSQNLYIF